MTRITVFHLKLPDTTKAKYPIAEVPPDSTHPFLDPSGRKTTGWGSLSGPDLLPKIFEYIPDISSNILPCLPSVTSPAPGMRDPAVEVEVELIRLAIIITLNCPNCPA